MSLRRLGEIAQIGSIAVQSVLLLCASRVGVSILGFQRTSELLDRPARSVGPVSDLTVRRCSAWVVRLAPLVRGSCLHRSLAIRTMLQRRGIDAQIEMGVRRQGAAIDGHAWVWDGSRVHGDAADVRDNYELMDWVSAAER